MAVSSASSSKPAILPQSGFRSPQFWLGLVAVVGVFILGTLNIHVDTSFINNLPSWAKDNLVPGAIVVGIVAAFIVISSYIETRTVARKGIDGKPTSVAPKGRRLFFQTSEFWLGLITVILGYLQDSGIAPSLRSSTSTTTFVIALAYTLARSQLKQAYISAQQDQS
jgi:uncharacterized membrane protein YfcA